jgi:hypothetical protein
MGFYDSLKVFFKELFESNSFNLLVNLLVILNCMSIIIELILEYIELSEIHRDYLELERTLNGLKAFQNGKSSKNASYLWLKRNVNSDEIFSKKHDHKLHLILRLIPVCISSLFMTELLLKIIFMRSIFRQKREIFDAVVIIAGFIVDVITLASRSEIATVVGLITIIR